MKPETMASEHQKVLMRADGTRLDSRLPMHCRPAFLRTGTVSAAEGSAYAEFGATKVIVSVYGPRESKKAQAFSDIGRLNCDVKFTTFASATRGQAGQGKEEKEYSTFLHKSIEGAIDLRSFPKTTVDVFALVIQSGGGDLPAIITCASMALADAGIVMYDMVAAVSVSSMARQLLLDPISEEENHQDGGLVVACMASRKEVMQMAMTGEWSSTKAAEALDLCIDACLKLGELMRTCLLEEVQSSF